MPQIHSKPSTSTYMFPNVMFRCSDNGDDVADADADTVIAPTPLPFFKIPLIGGEPPPLFPWPLLPAQPFTLIVTRVPPAWPFWLIIDDDELLVAIGVVCCGCGCGRLPIRFCETNIAVIFSTFDWVLYSDGRPEAAAALTPWLNKWLPFNAVCVDGLAFRLTERMVVFVGPVSMVLWLL